MKSIKSWASLALTLSLFLPACAQNGRSDGHALPAQATSSPASPAPAREGTVDGGGGAGIDGKPIESFERKLRDKAVFPEFEQFIEPILADVAKLYPNQDFFNLIVEHLISRRTWYVMPVELHKIGSENMGIPLSADQWAFQTTGAVWISSLHYTGANIDKARILMHEILVGIKFLRHLSDFEQCQAIYGRDFPSTCDRRDREPLYKEVKLNARDYDDVRAVTNWLFENHAKMTGEQFAAAMHDHNFFSHMFDFYSRLPDPDGNVRKAEQLPRRTDALNRSIAKENKLYTDYDEVTHVAKSICKLKMTFDKDNKTLLATVTVLDKETRKQTKSVSARFPFDGKPSFGDQGPFGPGNPVGAFNTSFSNLKEPRVKGKVYDNFMLNYAYDSISWLLFTKMSLDDTPTNGGSSASGVPDTGLECQNSEVLMPYEYPQWLSLPREDRETLERRWFHDTYENIKASKKYDIRFP